MLKETKEIWPLKVTDNSWEKDVIEDMIRKIGKI